MNKTKIEWCDSTWNPVTGCWHGCEYCYARRIAERFGGHIPNENPCTIIAKEVSLKKQIACVGGEMKKRFRKCGSCFRYAENWRDAKSKGLEPRDAIGIAMICKKPRKSVATICGGAEIRFNGYRRWLESEVTE